ncbi:MAG: ferredoxin family protein [Lentisphaeria bacterium]|nr:ferredoxin family protein [Lentisphaeria bacterium]
MDALLCKCANRNRLSDAQVDQLAATLAQQGLNVHVVDDLCAALEKRSPAVMEMLRGDSISLVAACHPRAVRWLCAQADIDLTPEVRLVDALAMDGEKADEPSSSPAVLPAPNQDSWHPVIDRDRCVDCGKCLDFCLFDVYERAADGTVRVANPANCKNNCPACARICPPVAIIFPKCPDEAINGGELTDEQLKAANVRVDPAMFGRGDVYAALMARRGKKKGAKSLFKPGVLPESEKKDEKT